MIIDRGLNITPAYRPFLELLGKQRGRIALKETLGRFWDREIVTCSLPEGFSPAGLAVFCNGVRVPSQAGHGRLAFAVENLGPGEERVYTVERAATGDMGESGSIVRLVRNGNYSIFSNGIVSFILPGTGSFRRGTSMSVPGPVVAVRRKTGPWLGRGRIETSVPIRSVQTRLVEAGPLWSAAQVRYRCCGGEEYAVTLFLGPGEETCRVEETSSIPLRLWPAPRPYREIGSLKWSFWRQESRDIARPCVRPWPMSNFIFELRKGWVCDRMITHSTSSWEMVDMPLGSEELRTYTAMRPALPFIDGAWMGAYDSRRDEVIGVCSMDLPFWTAPDDTIHPAHRTPGANAEVHLMDWGDAGPYFRFPIENIRRRWLFGVFSRSAWSGFRRPARARGRPVSLEPDPAMPLWNLHVRRSAFPLEKAAGWVTDWPEDGHEHPRLFCGPGDFEEIRRNVRSTPELWANYRRTRSFHPADRYLIEGEPVRLADIEAATHARELVEGILAKGYAGPVYGIGLSRPLRRYAAACDILWNCFTDEERREARRVCALAAYILTDGGWWQYAYRDNETTYLPNFNSDVFTCAGILGLFLSDHPCSGPWARYLVKRMDVELKRHMRPDGCGEENVGCYYPHTVYALYFPAMWALRRAGLKDYSRDRNLLAGCRFFLNVLEPPNPRDRGLRQLPPIGDHPYARKDLSWAPWLAAFVKDSDPELAGALMWAWRATGSFVHRNHDHSGPAAEPLTLHYIFHDPSISEKSPALRSAQLPNVGAVLRTDRADAKGSYVFFKAGRVHCHHEDDEGSFHYYGRGVPLALDGLPLQNGTPAHRHNAVTFGRHGQPTMNVECFVSTPVADYVRGRVIPRGFCSDTMYVDGSHRSGWERQILLVKAGRPGGVEYLVVKDVTCGPDECQWNEDVLSRRPAHTGPGRVWFPGHRGRGFGMGLDVIVIEPAGCEIAIEKGVVSRDVTSPRLRRKHAIAAGGSGIRLLYRVVEHWLIHVPAPPGSTFMVVLFPRRPGETPPAVRYLGREETIEISHGEGRDIVFLRPNPAVELNLDGIRFQGRAGLVSVRRGARLVQPLDACLMRVETFPDKDIRPL